GGRGARGWGATPTVGVQAQPARARSSPGMSQKMRVRGRWTRSLWDMLERVRLGPSTDVSEDAGTSPLHPQLVRHRGALHGRRERPGAPPGAPGHSSARDQTSPLTIGAARSRSEQEVGVAVPDGLAAVVAALDVLLEPAQIAFDRA